MAELLLLHHALGVTPALQRLAARFRDAGHTVVLPDLFEGQVFGTVEEGMAHVESVGMDTLAARGEDTASDLDPGFVVCGISLGAIAAQRIGVDHDAVAAVMAVSSCLPPGYLPGPWPHSVPLRVVASKGDTMFNEEGDLDAARGYVDAGVARLKLLDGGEHLFMEANDPDSVAATAWLTETLLHLLDRVDEDRPLSEPTEEEREIWDLP